MAGESFPIGGVLAAGSPDRGEYWPGTIVIGRNNVHVNTLFYPMLKIIFRGHFCPVVFSKVTFGTLTICYPN